MFLHEPASPVCIFVSGSAVSVQCGGMTRHEYIPPPPPPPPPCSPRLVCIAHSFTMASMASSGGGAAATTTATTAAAAPVDQSSPSTSRWHSTMQSDRMATKAELIDYRRIYEQVLFVDIPGYYNRSGRYQQVDTARVIELNNILNDLFYGKTPDAYTHE